jgi:hypothetical protein
MVTPRIYGLFHRHLAGDDALLQLAKRRFEEAGLAAELYPGDVDQALAEWPLAPQTGTRHFAHLPRHLDVVSDSHRNEIRHFAAALAGRAEGLVVHDQANWLERESDVRSALLKLDAALGAIRSAPAVFVEYAAGLPLDWFLALAEHMRKLSSVNICVDVGHVLMFATHRRFQRFSPGIDFWSLPRDVEQAPVWLSRLDVAMKLGTTDLLSTIQHIVELGGPIHFHLHDAHPLSLLSRYGVRDHLSFLQKVPVAPSVHPDGIVDTMLGPRGLSEIVRRLPGASRVEQITLTLEIHPTAEGAMQSLGPHAELFEHWTDLTHAEVTNAWLSTQAENAELVRQRWLELHSKPSCPHEPPPTGATL